MITWILPKVQKVIGVSGSNTNILKKKQLTKEDKDLLELKSKLNDIRRMVNIEQMNLNLTDDSDLIEAHIYNINSLEKQYSYYFKKTLEK